MADVDLYYLYKLITKSKYDYLVQHSCQNAINVNNIPYHRLISILWDNMYCTYIMFPVMQKIIIFTDLLHVDSIINLFSVIQQNK